MLVRALAQMKRKEKGKKDGAKEEEEDTNGMDRHTHTHTHVVTEYIAFGGAYYHDEECVLCPEPNLRHPIRGSSG